MIAVRTVLELDEKEPDHNIYDSRKVIKVIINNLAFLSSIFKTTYLSFEEKQ
jgi:hypothetical protein